MRAPRPGHGVIAAALVAAAVLVGVELQRGALGDGPLAVPDPCTRTVDIDTGGIDGYAQRIGLRALDHAACRMDTTREELLLSVAGSLQEARAFPEGAEGLLREGVVAGIAAEQEAGRLNVVAAFVLRQAAERAPVDWVVRAVEGLAALG